MTGIRMSFLYTLESNFGEGKDESHVWIAPPPGARFRCTMSRQATRVQATGTKHWDTYAYGTFQGSWDMTFMLDYNYLEPLYFAFEASDANGTEILRNGVGTGVFTYSFNKDDAKRVPSFCVRLLQLNRMAGGPEGQDQIVELKGCVCKSITMARSAGSSQFQVTMSGFYVDEEMKKGNLGSTDYQPYEGNLTEYSCLYIGSGSATTLDQCTYVANTESMTIAVDNSADAIYNVCSPFAQQYFEGITNYTFSAVTYRNNPENWEQRQYSGGYSNKDSNNQDILKPLAKGLKPMPLAWILTYDKEIDATNTTPIAAYKASERSLGVKITKCVLRSLERPNGDGSKLVDTISSADCQLIGLDFKTKVGNFSFDAPEEGHDPDNANAVMDVSDFIVGE